MQEIFDNHFATHWLFSFEFKCCRSEIIYLSKSISYYKCLRSMTTFQEEIQVVKETMVKEGFQAERGSLAKKEMMVKEGMMVKANL